MVTTRARIRGRLDVRIRATLIIRSSKRGCRLASLIEPRTDLATPSPSPLEVPSGVFEHVGDLFVYVTR